MGSRALLGDPRRRLHEPLRPGALSPYRDTTKPTIGGFGFERDGTGVGRALRGVVDLVVEAWDDVPVAVPAPWNAKPVAPACVEWRLRAVRGRYASRWAVAAGFRRSIPHVPFRIGLREMDAPEPPVGARRPWPLPVPPRVTVDMRSLADGRYRLDVRLADSRGNTTTRSATFVVANGRA